MNTLNDVKIQIDKVDYARATSTWSKKSFPYAHHRIYYVVDGQATLILNDAIHILQPGFIYLLPAFSLVETICKHSLTHHFIHFQLLHNDVLDIFSIYKPAVKVKAPKDAAKLFNEIKDNFKTDHPYSTMKTYSAIYSLLAPFFQSCPMTSEIVLRFKPVLNYIDNNLESKLTNKELAQVLNLDPVYFSNLFSKAFSIPPNQYIIKKRLERAQTLLTSTDLNITEISSQSGYDNNMYFSRLFKNRIGLTPSEYRRRNKKVNLITTSFLE